MGPQNPIAEHTMTHATSLKELSRIASKNTVEEYGNKLYAIGQIGQAIAIDGTVATSIGKIDGCPLYQIVPSAFEIQSSGDLKIFDSHPSWLEAGNGEEVVIPSRHIEFCLIAEIHGGSMRIPDEANQYAGFGQMQEMSSTLAPNPRCL